MLRRPGGQASTCPAEAAAAYKSRTRFTPRGHHCHGVLIRNVIMLPGQLEPDSKFSNLKVNRVPLAECQLDRRRLMPAQLSDLGCILRFSVRAAVGGTVTVRAAPFKVDRVA